MTLNWKRILTFVVVLIATTFVVGFAFGTLAGASMRSGRIAPESFVLIQGLIVFLVVTLLFLVLGYVQREQTILHAVAVAVLAWLVSFPLNVLYGKQPLLQWALGVIALLLFALLGSGIGMLIRRATAKDDQSSYTGAPPSSSI